MECWKENEVSKSFKLLNSYRQDEGIRKC